MSNIVQISKETLEILKVMASINNSIKILAGNVLKTISPNGSVIMETEIAETFPQDFAIYELNRLLAVLNLNNMKDAVLEFSDDKKIVIRAGKVAIDFFFANEEFVSHPGKTVQLPSVDLSVELTQENIDDFVKGAAALGHKILAFRAENGVVKLVATTPEIDTSNNMEIELPAVDGAEAPIDGEYKIKLEYVKLIPGDYLIQICSRGIMRLEHKTRKVVSFIGLERV